MGEKYFHYTSRQIAQEIIISGYLKPTSVGGRIYLTQDTFENGAEAAKRLSILGKPIEVVCVIPADKVKDKIENLKPYHIDDIIGPNGEILRPGCGQEYFTYPDKEIEVKECHWYDLPTP